MSTDSGSDRIAPRSTGSHTGPGPGMLQNFHCDRCKLPRPVLGRKRVRRGCMLFWHCRVCVAPAVEVPNG